MRIKILPRLLVIIFICLAALAPFQGSSAAPERQFTSDEIVPGELIIGTGGGFSAESVRSVPGISMLAAEPELTQLGARLVKVPAGSEANYQRILRQQKGVRYVEPNYRVQADLVPNDPLYSQQYGLPQIQAPAAWDITTGSSSVILAIIDSGIDSSKTEFAGRIVPGYDFVNNDTIPDDRCGHGTHVAGIAAAQGNNASGVAGVDWNVRIMPVKVLTVDAFGGCSGTTLNIALGMVWAVERGARVINESLGTFIDSEVLKDGSYYAYTHGAAIFAASGNGFASSVDFPAAYPWVMAVGATDASLARVNFSNTGPELDLMAPGDQIESTLPVYAGALYRDPSGYGKLTGTSMATAYASGAGALLASLAQFDTPDKIYQALTSTALDLGTPGRDDSTGYGLIQLHNALLFSPTIVPTPTPLPPAISYDSMDSTGCANLVSYNWRDASGGPFVGVFGDEGAAPPLALPFSFNLGGVSYSTITVSPDGYAALGGDGSNGGIADNFFMPGIAEPNNFIAPFWDDLTQSVGSAAVYQETIGTAPNREYVIEWSQFSRYDTAHGEAVSGSNLTFEAVLFETSGNILYQYQQVLGPGGDGSSATVGVEYGDGTLGHEYSFDQSGALAAGRAVLFVPYATGGTPPSNSCSSLTQPVDGSGGFFESLPFCVSIPAGAMQHSGTLQIQIVASVPKIPSRFLDLDHYADIKLSYVPPPPLLSPMPEAYVCYHYTTLDLLKAGGHPGNLFFIAYNATSRSWQQLATSANPVLQTITTRAPHFSFYAVVTNGSPPQQLPVTGALIAPFVLEDLGAAGIGLALALLLGAWIWKRGKEARGR